MEPQLPCCSTGKVNAGSEERAAAAAVLNCQPSPVLVKGNFSLSQRLLER